MDCSPSAPTIDWLGPQLGLTAQDDYPLFKRFQHSIVVLFQHIAAINGRLDGEKTYALQTAGKPPVALIFARTIRMDLSNQGIFLDAAVVSLDEQFLKSNTSDPIYALGESGEVVTIDAEPDELKLWKYALPFFAERCRNTNWKHKSSCEYREAGRIPTSTEPGKPYLCTCGAGHGFPPDLFAGSRSWEALSQYATRVAITPLHKSPLVQLAGSEHRSSAQRQFDVEKEADLQVMRDALALQPPGCDNCGRMTSRADGGNLARCGGCRLTKYCSKRCQKDDWIHGGHREECNIMVENMRLLNASS